MTPTHHIAEVSKMIDTRRVSCGKVKHIDAYQVRIYNQPCHTHGAISFNREQFILYPTNCRPLPNREQSRYCV